MPYQIFETLELVATTLDALETKWALIGGLAVSSYCEPRFTRDIDLAISVKGDAEAEAFVNAWSSRNFTIDSVIEQDALGRLATVRSKESGSADGIFVDLLFASSGIEQEIALEAREMEIMANLWIPVARPAHLFALKLLCVDDQRPKDQIDLRELSPLIVAEELMATQKAIALIKDRGFHRGRDLEALLTQYRAI